MIRKIFSLAILLVGLVSCAQTSAPESSSGQGGGNASQVTPVTATSTSTESSTASNSESTVDESLTPEELDRLMPSFQNQIAVWVNEPAPEQEQDAQDFAEDWATVDSEVALFVGKWQGTNQEVAIYPSNKRGQACILHFQTIEEESAEAEATDPDAERETKLAFSVGTVSENTLVTDQQQTIFRQDKHLGIVSDTEKGLGINAYRLSAPVDVEPPPLTEWENGSQVTRSLGHAGCLSDLGL